MKVRRCCRLRPTLWSVRRGETEYGVKALPFGGFCDIAGMTPYDELADDERDRAMFRQKPWKRFVVLLAGPAQNFVLVCPHLLRRSTGGPAESARRRRPRAGVRGGRSAVCVGHGRGG